MQLYHQQNPNIDSISKICASIEHPDPDDSNNKVIFSNLSRFSIELSIHMENQEKFNEILLEKDDRGAIDPAIINEFQENKEVITEKSTIISPSIDPTNIRVYCEIEQTIVGPFTIPIPPYDAIETAGELLRREDSCEELDCISEIYDRDNDMGAAFSLLEDLEKWITVTNNFQILNAAARISDDIKRKLNADRIGDFLASQLAYSDSRVAFDIMSQKELDRIISTCESLQYIPHINKFEIIRKTVRMVHKNGDMNQLWELEQRFGLASNYWREFLWDEQMTALLGRALIEEDLEKVEQIIINWLGPLIEADDINDEIEDAKTLSGEKAIRTCQLLLRKAATLPEQDLYFVSSLYIHKFQNSRDSQNPPLYLDEEMCKARSELSERVGSYGRARTAKYQYHMKRGRRYRAENYHEDACDEFKQALELSLEEGMKIEERRFTAPEWAIFQLFFTRIEWSRRDDNYESAKETANEGRAFLKSLSVVRDEKTRQDCILHLEALQYESEGDQLLSKNQLDAAKRSYGQAIGKYIAIKRNDKKSYLIRRQKLISAQIAEQRGEFADAEIAHRAVAENADSKYFKSFNTSRAEVCAAKKALVDLDWGQARKLIQPHLDSKNIAGVEANHIELLLDVLDSYENNMQLSAPEVFEQLESLPEVEESAEEFPFNYGHEYRPALANILAAQRLQKLGIDSSFLNDLIAISLRDVLAPDQAKHTIEERGVHDIGLSKQWKFKFPIHVVKRFQEIEADEIVARDNFSDRGLALLKLLEQTLEFVADYYGQKIIGPNWADQYSQNSEGRLSFGALRNFLNTETMENCLWINSVCNLFDEPLVGEEDVIAVRNMLGHDRQSWLSEEEYKEIKNRVTDILDRMASELPVIGEIESEHKLGAYIFKPHWEDVQKWCYLRVDTDLEQNTVYYLPPGSLQSESIVQLDAEAVIECSANRVLDNLAVYKDTSGSKEPKMP